MSEETKRDLHFGYFGNGLTVYDVSVIDPEINDHPTVAHISEEGNIKMYVNDIDIDDVKHIKEAAAREREKFLDSWNKMGVLRKYEKLLDNAPYDVYREMIDDESYNDISLDKLCTKYMPKVFFADYTYFDSLSNEDKEYFEKVVPQCIDRFENHIQFAENEDKAAFYRGYLLTEKKAIANNLGITVDNLDYLVDEYRRYHTESVIFNVRGSKGDLLELRDGLLREGKTLHFESYCMEFSVAPEEKERIKEILDGRDFEYHYEYDKKEVNKVYRDMIQSSSDDLYETVKRFFESEDKVTVNRSGEWRIGAGGYDLVAEIYQNNIPVCGVYDCYGGGYEVKSYNGDLSVVDIVSKAVNEAGNHDPYYSVLESPLIDKAKECIQTFFEDEYGDENNEIEDITDISLAYTTDEETNCNIYAKADLVNFTVYKEMGYSYSDDNGELQYKYCTVSKDTYSSLKDMIDCDLSCLGGMDNNFDKLISISDEEREKFYSEFPEERPDETPDFSQGKGDGRS